MMVGFLTDNMAVVHALTKRTAQDPHLSHFLHCLFFLEATCRFEHRVSTSQGSRMWVQMCCPVTTCQFSCLSSRRPPQQLPSPHPSWSCCLTTTAVGSQVLVSQFFSRLSHDIQKEMLQIMAHQILRALIKNVSSSNWFAIIADEATDASLVEQIKCMCVVSCCANYSVCHMCDD